jgi:glucose-6-phosphate dehydrogenase assembly protein OpcA
LNLNLGIPVVADPEAIEQELRAFWSSTSGDSTEQSMVRACSCNLVVLARDRREAAGVLPVLAKVSEWHPHRAIVICPPGREASAVEGPLIQAWLGAQCAVPSAGGTQVCSESITIETSERAVGDAPNLVSALLVPDLPAYLYWRSFSEADLELAAFLARFASVLIVDSHASTDDREKRDELLELLTGRLSGLPVRDLNWERLTAWRDIVAQFFDPPALRHMAREITQVEVERDIAATGHIPTRTLLLTGWLASRLGWEGLSAERAGDSWESVWTGPGGTVTVHFSGRLAGSGSTPGISSIALKTASGAVFRARKDAGSFCIVAESQGAGMDFVHSVPLPGLGEENLLARELSLAGEDPSFAEALRQAIELERRFRRPSAR